MKGRGCLRQLKYICGHLSHKYSVAFNQVVISTLPLGTLDSVASLLAATLYQGNPDRIFKFWHIGSTVRYILHMHVVLEYCYNVYAN
jgi:hypothetical protein